MATAEAKIQNKISKTGKSVTDKQIKVSEVVRLSENVNVEEIKKSSEEDLESLLKLAEELKEKVEDESKLKQLRFFRIVQIGAFLILPYYVYSTITSFGVQTTFEKGVDLLFIGFLIGTITGTEATLRIIKKSIIPEKLALREVLQLLREVHGTIAEREDWSILKRAEFRIRLSRFDLSEKKESVFNFFS